MASNTQAIIKNKPPIGVTIPSLGVSVSVSTYNEPEKIMIPIRLQIAE